MTTLPVRFRPDRFTLLTAAFAALGAALVLGRVLTFGVGLSPDSAHYIAAARSLLAGEGILRFDGLALTFFPPLYPLLLAAASLGTFDPVDVAGPLNAVIFGLTVFIVGRYLQRRLESRLLAAWGCLATALAVPLLERSSWAHSEPLFILLATLALVQADRFLTEGRLRALVQAAAFSALAWQTRYVGVAVPAFVGLLLLFQHRASMTQRAVRVTTCSLIAAAPTALWLLRNLLATGELTRHPPPANYPVPMLMRDVVDILWSWAQTNAAAVLAPFVAVLVVVQLVQWRRFRRFTVVDCRDWRPFWLFGGFALTYLVLFIAAIYFLVGIYLEDGVTDRLLIPLYVPLLMAGVFALDRVLDHERKRTLSELSGRSGSVHGPPIVRTMMSGKKGRKECVLAAVVTIVLSLGVASQTVSSVSVIARPDRDYRSLGFNGPSWTASETLRHVRGNLIATRIYSNAPMPLSLHIGKNREYAPFHCVPHVRAELARLWTQEHAPFHCVPEKRAELERLPSRSWTSDGADGADGAYVVWFTRPSHQPRDYGEADLRCLPGLETVAESEDGVVFRVADEASEAIRLAELPCVPGRTEVVPAVFAGAEAPVVGDLFVVRLSDATRRAGFTDRGPWRWERGSDAAGWQRAGYGTGASYSYVPSADDVGLRLRAYTFYTDGAGNLVQAMTPASAPVAAR